MFRESKKRFKLYKSGKFWVSAPILFFGMSLGSASYVKADQVQTTKTEPVTVQTSSTSQTSSLCYKQQKTVTLSSKAATANSQDINSNTKSSAVSIQSSSKASTPENKQSVPFTFFVI